MVEAAMLLLWLLLGAVAIGILWSMLVAWRRNRRGYRSSSDADKETPPPGWITPQWVICTHCDRGWWKHPADDTACPYCHGNARVDASDIEWKSGDAP